MKKYYAQYDLWEADNEPPRVIKLHMEGKSVSDVVERICAAHDGKRVLFRVAYLTEDNSSKDNGEPRKFFSRILLILMGLFGLSMTLGDTISQFLGR
jgi:hypothetical protein